MTKPHYTEDRADYPPEIKFPDLATPAIRRLIVKGKAKHPEDDWDKQSIHHHATRAFAHLVDYFVTGFRCDLETGESPLLHAACRLLMVVHILERKRIGRGGE